MAKRQAAPTGSPRRSRRGAQAEETFSAGMSEPVSGGAHNPADINIQSLMRSRAPSPSRPTWQVTRVPVMPNEYMRLREEAREPEPTPRGPVEAVVDEGIGDEDTETVPTINEAPEGQDVRTLLVATGAPRVTTSFLGIGQTPYHPADPAIAVGPNDVLLAVNAEVAVYTREGALRFRWPGLHSLFSAVLPPDSMLFDPQVVYDHYDRRWVIVAVAKRNSPAGSWVMLAASQTADPAGAWWTWALDGALDGATPTGNWFDYPRLGFDTQALYIAGNMFLYDGGYQYAKLRILNKAEVYAGGDASTRQVRWHDLVKLTNPDGSLAFTVQPALHYRGTGGNPPVYMVNCLWPGGSTLTLWTLTDPLAPWRGGQVGVTRVAVPCRPYALPPDSLQPGSDNRLSTADTRLLNTVYQYVGTTQRLWTCHHTRHTWPGDTEARCAVQWYEIDVQTQQVIQNNRYGAPKKYYFYPAISTDGAGNAHLFFGRSSGIEYAQLRATGRQVGDAPGELHNSVLVQPGISSYMGNRWGDYFSVCRDPVESTTVWMYGMYAEAGNTWATYVCATTY